MTQDSVESSVLFSLAELQQMEQQRLQTEEQQRVTARERREREQREAEARRREDEAVRHKTEQDRLQRERAAREEQVRKIAESEAREQARNQVAQEIARIEAEAKVRLVAEEQARTYELQLLRARTHAKLYRVCLALSVILTVVLCSGALVAWKVQDDFDQLKQAVREGLLERDTLIRDRDRMVAEYTEARTTWQGRVQALQGRLTTCETQNHMPLPLKPPGKLPLGDRHPPTVEPPKTKCKLGDPLCDVTGGPR